MPSTFAPPATPLPAWLPAWLPVVLALWLGAGGLFALVVAPAAFEVLPTTALAGALVARVLPVLFWSGAVVGAFVLVGLWRSGFRRGWRAALAVALIATSLGAELGVAPRIARLRASIGPSVGALDPADPRRRSFGVLHGVSVLLLGVGMAAAAGLTLGSVANRRPPSAASEPSSITLSPSR